ncbi:MAG TPA: cell wall hydrolase [Rhizomicrobium sp.]|nr:cell wall hydrolase [Rhizomicrobium sp.]
MTKKTNDALSRSDRVLIAALAIVLATASAAIGASLTNHPVIVKAALTKSAPALTRVIPAAAPSPDAAMTQLLAEHRCLSEVLYYEARGEGTQGEKAVAEVVYHRMNTGNYGHSICAVVYEGAGHPGCQFSFTCNGDLHRRKEAPAWSQAEQLAAQILTGQAWRKNSTEGATNYHAVSVTPDWAPALEKTTQIGNHIFYRNGPHTS